MQFAPQLGIKALCLLRPGALQGTASASSRSTTSPSSSSSVPSRYRQRAIFSHFSCPVGSCWVLCLRDLPVQVDPGFASAVLVFMRSSCVQVDPGFAYAYTLLGHEFALTEELDRALACFRNAIRVNNRHYNAWYLHPSISTTSLYHYTTNTTTPWHAITPIMSIHHVTIISHFNSSLILSHLSHYLYYSYYY